MSKILPYPVNVLDVLNVLNKQMSDAPSPEPEPEGFDAFQQVVYVDGMYPLYPLDLNIPRPITTGNNHVICYLVGKLVGEGTGLVCARSTFQSINDGDTDLISGNPAAEGRQLIYMRQLQSGQQVYCSLNVPETSDPIRVIATGLIAWELDEFVGAKVVVDSYVQEAGEFRWFDTDKQLYLGGLYTDGYWRVMSLFLRNDSYTSDSETALRYKELVPVVRKSDGTAGLLEVHSNMFYPAQSGTDGAPVAVGPENIGTIFLYSGLYSYKAYNVDPTITEASVTDIYVVLEESLWTTGPFTNMDPTKLHAQLQTFSDPDANARFTLETETATFRIQLTKTGYWAYDAI